jgi:hypothetical protein
LIGSGTLDQPPTDPWQSETVHEGTEEQLHHIADWLTPGTVVSDQVIGKIAAEAFHCAGLRPSNLVSVYEDASVVVRRPVAASNTSRDLNQHTYSGPEGVIAALKDLRLALPNADTGHAKFKTIRVQVDDTAATTVSYFELSGRGPGHSAEIHATWRCDWRMHDDAWLLQHIEVSDYEEAASLDVAGKIFTDCTESALDSNASYRELLLWSLDHWMARIDKIYGGSPEGWCGISVADVNGDDLEDFYLSHPGGLPNQLFTQQPDGTFKDTSREAHVDWWDDTHASLFADLDNDGDQDLVVSTALGLIIMENDGRGVFTDRAFKLAPEARPVSVCAADYDEDGDLDIYACCYSLRLNIARSHGLLGRPIPYHDANNGGRNILYRNDPSWKFVDVTKQVGLDENNRRFSLAASWEDFDNDGDLDLYVANDYGRNNLYRNNFRQANGQQTANSGQEGKPAAAQFQFTDIAGQAGVEDISAGMSVTWGDYNQDGLMDLYVSNMFSSAGNRVTYQRRFQPGFDQQTRQDFQRHARGNSLFTNTGLGDFTDDSVRHNVTMGRWAWASMFVDINNDTREDLLVANGFLTRADPGDL